ncbi:MAG: SPOR domain-containing protein [Spirochaeta sp.]|nr:SPOR domain-containing protein [Spirochaeta sp.]
MHQPIVVCRHFHTKDKIKLRSLRGVALTIIFTSVAFLLSAQTPSSELSFANSLQRLERQPEHPQFFERLIDTALLAESPGLASDILLKHRDRVQQPRELAEIDLLLGRFAQIRSNLTSALEYYSAAAEADTPFKPRALSALAALQLEIGELERALDTAEQAAELLGSTRSATDELSVSSENTLGYWSLEKSWERTLLTQASALVGLERRDQALELLTAATRETSPRATPAVLLRLIELASEQDDETLLSDTYDTLVEAYPDSPERRLAARYRESGTAGVVGADLVEYFPSPSRVLSGGSPEIATRRAPSATDIDTPDNNTVDNATEPGSEPDAVDSPEPDASTEHNVYGVQTGSFRDAENAQYMVQDLQERDFQARQRNRTVGNNEFYQVYVPVDGGDPQELLVQLKELGFEGFLLFQ